MVQMFRLQGLRFDGALGFKLMHGLGVLGYGASGFTAWDLRALGFRVEGVPPTPPPPWPA